MSSTVTIVKTVLYRMAINVIDESRCSTQCQHHSKTLKVGKTMEYTRGCNLYCEHLTATNINDAYRCRKCVEDFNNPDHKVIDLT